MADPIRQYAQTRSPEAFAAVVRNHVDAVYSQCLRQLRDPAAAEDITQQVFASLAQKAATLSPNVVLSGWLFTATRYCCGNYRRAALRRAAAERKAAFMRTEAIRSPQDAEVQPHMEAILDDAISNLGKTDRNAVILRYFQGHSMREVAMALGISEDAAKQRVFRAIEKLRSYFFRHGVVVPSASLTAFMGGLIKPAPAGVAVKAVLSHSVAFHGVGLFTRLVWVAPKIAAITALGVGIVTGVIVAGRVVSAQTPASPPPPQMPIAVDVLATTQPLSQSTPGDALNKLCAAIASDDKAAIDQCLCDDGKNPDQAALGRAYVEEIASVYRLENTWQNKFSFPMSVDGYGFDDFMGGPTYEVLFRSTMDTPGGPDVTINGDVAKIRVSGSPQSFAGSGPDRLTAQERWSGAMLTFNYIHGDWKLNTDRTFNFLIILSRTEGNNAEGLKIESQVAHAISAGLDQTAIAIEKGDIKSAKQANTTIQKQMRDIFRDAAISGVNVMALPVIGG